MSTITKKAGSEDLEEGEIDEDPISLEKEEGEEGEGEDGEEDEEEEKDTDEKKEKKDDEDEESGMSETDDSELGDEEDEDEEDDILEEEKNRGKPIQATTNSKFEGMWSDDEDGEDDEDEEDDNYLQKFDRATKENIIADHHPELQAHNSEEVDLLANVIRDENGVISDPLHRTLPFITKYEKARILGERAKQLDAGAVAMIDVDPTVIDGYLIALKEYEQKKIPFIVKRPLPNGACEYWRFSDLELM